MKFFIVIYVLLSTSFLYAQSKLPIIKANSKKVAIKDGNVLDNNAWTLSPATKPDIYTCDRTRETKWVTFYTDIDSIKVKIKAGTTFDFIILLNNKDSCYTQIKSAIPKKDKTKKINNKSDTIPFILTKNNAIHVNSIINNRDTLNLHFDVGSFDFRLTRDAILKKTKLLAHQTEFMAGKAKPNYNQLEKVFKIQLGNVIFENPNIVPTGFTAHQMDGRFGWNVFEGKSVEIDYEKSIIIVHSKLPKNKKGYVKSKLKFIRSFVCVESNFIIKNKQYSGDFILDTGSNQAIILDSAWVMKQKFPQDLPFIKSSKLKDPRGVIYENKILLSPLLALNNFKVTNIPTSLLGSKNPLRFEINYFGNDLLKRFNTIIDFENDYLYLKPNSLMNLPYLDAK
ncbi:MAG: hypothetical protein EAZ85_08285 [Bacteroidetes bacterium]|nr:MAG: hypothetical protein EAZ85_08285 [Bacteroidota bacterium]TAG89504.1 MAG: hypothetical protein EAZ20_06370 [Bacteroidota bacterium]